MTAALEQLFSPKEASAMAPVVLFLHLATICNTRQMLKDPADPGRMWKAGDHPAIAGNRTEGGGGE